MSLLRHHIILGLLPSAPLTAPVVAHILSPREERMIYYHLGAPALLRILLQALIDEILELLRPYIGGNSRRLTLHYIEKYAGLLFVDVWRFTVG